MDRITIDMNIMTQEALADVKELNKSLEQTSKLIKSMSTSKASGEDIDRVLLEVQADLRKAASAKRKMDEDMRRPDALSHAGDRLRPTTKKKAAGTMDKELKKVLESFSESISNMAKTSETQSRMSTSRSRVVGGPTNRLKLEGESFAEGPMFPGEDQLEIRQAQRDRQKVTSRVTSSVSALEKAEGTGRLSYNQAETLRGNMQEVFYSATGASEEHLEDVKAYARGKGDITWDIDDTSPLGRAQKGMATSGNKMQELQDELLGIQGQIGKGEEKHTPEEFNNLLLAEEKTLEEMQSQLRITEENRKLLTEIVDGVRRLDESYEEFKTNTAETGTHIEAAKGTPAHAIASRSNAIALTAMTAGLYALSSSIKKGIEVVGRERAPSMEIGYGMGNYDFRSIRQDARETGRDYGFSGEEMLEHQRNVMGSLGFTPETMGISEELARSERISGTQEGTMTQVFDSLLRTGAIQTQGDARDITDQITGSLVTGELEGRAEEQVTALQGILEAVTSGRAVGSREAQDQLAIAGLLSEMGGESLQGSNLEKNLGGLNEAISGMDVFGDMAMFMGVGSDSDFAGPDGMFNFRAEVEKGIGSEKVLDGIRNMVDTMGADYAKSMMVESEVFSNLSTDAIESIVELAEQGVLTLENAADYASVTADVGSSEAKRREEGFKESPDYQTLLGEAYAQNINANVDDSKLGDFKRWGSNIVGEAGSSSPTASIATVIGKSVVTTLGAVLAPTLALTLGSHLKDFGGMAMGDLLGTGTLGIPGIEGKGMLSKGAKMWGGMKDAASAANASFTAPMASKGLITSGVIKSGQEIFGGIRKVSEAERKEAEAVHQTAEVGGKLGGMWGLGYLGAQAGTAIMPGVGTLIGGGIGGLAGLLGGGEIGGGLGEWITGRFMGGTDDQIAAGEDVGSFVKTATAAEGGMEGQDIAEGQREVAVVAAQENIGVRRKDNIESEARNLSDWDRLMLEIRKILEISREQNGIIGNADGLAGIAGGGSSKGVAGELGIVSKGEYWTSVDKTKHDLGKTVSDLTAGQLDAWISDKAKSGSSMIGMGEAFMEAGNHSGLDPRYLVAHAALETDWGQSPINKDKHNFFGIGAYDHAPYRNAYDFSDPKDGIIGGAKWLADNYYALGDTDLSKMHDGNSPSGKRYASDPNWAAKVAATMGGSEKYTSKSSGDTNVTNNINIETPKGYSEQSATQLARMIGGDLEDIFLNEHVLI